jgi:hypothetical protein
MVDDWLKAGGRMLAIGLDQADVDALPFKIFLKKTEHIATFFNPPGVNFPFAGIGPADVHNNDPRELPLISRGAQIISDGILSRTENANVVFCQMAPWQFAGEQRQLKQPRRRASFTVSRLLATMGVAISTPLLDRFHQPVDASEKRWLNGLYLDQPEEWDDPYRFFRW